MMVPQRRDPGGIRMAGPALEDDRPLRDLVADAVRAEILSGVLPPGTRVREEQLALDHGVSRVPVREALQKLAGEGFLTLSPRRGATVSTASPAKAVEVMEIRRSLELLAVRRTAEVRGGELAAELVKVVDAGSLALAARDHRRLPPLVERFHDLVAAASGNQELIVLLAGLRSRLGWMFAVDDETRSNHAWSEHAAILDAVLDGDPDLAVRLMDAHLEVDELVLRARASEGPAPS
jgi:DNA-binding GntR family transcriptional regulator